MQEETPRLGRILFKLTCTVRVTCFMLRVVHVAYLLHSRVEVLVVDLTVVQVAASWWR